MKKKIKILMLIFVAICFHGTIYGQPEIDELNAKINRLNNSNYSRKSEISDLKKELESLEKKYAEPLRINDSLNIEIDRLKRLDADRQTQLETLINISGNTSSNVGNKLDTIALLLGVVGLVLSIAAIWLGIFINRKEKKISELLDRSDANLKKQAESEKKANETREAINKDLTLLYKKLRREELKDILKRVDKDPMQVEIHTSRLLTLDLQEEHFIHLKNLFFKWSMVKEHRYLNSNLTLLLISQFPEDVAINQEFLPLMKYHFERAFNSVGFDKLEIFMSKLLNDFVEAKYPEVDDILLKAIQAISRYYNPDYVAEKMLFGGNENKEGRFKIYNLVKQAQQTPFLLNTYKQNMINTYGNPKENTDEQNKLIEEMKGKNTPQNKVQNGK